MNNKLIAVDKTYEVKVTGGKILPVKIVTIENDMAEGIQVGTANRFRFKLSKVKRDYVPPRPPPDPKKVKQEAIKGERLTLVLDPFLRLFDPAILILAMRGADHPYQQYGNMRNTRRRHVRYS